MWLTGLFIFNMEKLIPLMESGLITPCFSRETLGELRKVLLRPKFKTRLAKMSLEVKTILETLKQNSKIFNLPKIEEILVKEDPADDKFLLLGQVAKAKYLVSGDTHLLKLAKFGTIKIISVSEFLTIHANFG